MKAKKAIEVIDEVACMTCSAKVSITLVDRGSGKEFEVDMPKTLTIARGVLAWTHSLLAGSMDDVSKEERLKHLLKSIGYSIALDASDDGAE